MLPIDHLSASSISLFLRCPEQWRHRYILGEPQVISPAVLIGSAVHLGLSRVLLGEDPGSFWLEALKKQQEDGVVVDWARERPDACAEWAIKLVYHYHESVGKFLPVQETESEFLIDVPGVPIPVKGITDIRMPGRIIDVKTTRYQSPRQVRLNPEWKFQMNVYQLVDPVPGEFHVLTRSKDMPVYVPDSTAHMLYVDVPNGEHIKRIVRQAYEKMLFSYEKFADEPWSGGETHEWAGRYCSVKECCQYG